MYLLNPNHRFRPEYYRNCLDILETSLGQLDAYRAWRAFDPGAAYHVDLRYAALTGFLPGLYSRGKPFFGLSAGSIMLARERIRRRDPDGRVEALGGPGAALLAPG